ncbi:MauE/DoxX family redox-associated membrane protein [Rhodococcus sp. HNM0569]|uniref:MauE/DoxX family redox-associated membrane protein n=1 Tax=Rhodococcus sp. HNM0569 TaxID=2716340 RepID=UPI00146B7E38|nr:MauE/DoxX family redox-associated membrane protein [Rhodococcus sp. HNM0569]NLU82622.1 methylamine utilization protein [Rhodococcus sp. HNM0569]
MIWSFVASLVGGTLLAAGVPKIRDHDAVLRAVRGYRLLPSPLERATARVLPWAETVVGALLVCGVADRAAGAAAAALFVAFFVGLTANLARGRTELDCGCFAFAQHGEAPRIGWFHAARAAALALVSLVLVVSAPAATTAADTAAGAVLAATVLAGVLAAAQLRAVVHLGRRPVDEHLSRASIELRAASTLSRYAP